MNSLERIEKFALLLEEVKNLNSDLVFDFCDYYEDIDKAVSKIATTLLESNQDKISDEDALLIARSVKEKVEACLASTLLKVASPEKYKHIDFKPTSSMRDAAKRGLELRKKNNGKGGLSAQQAKQNGVGSGVARARDIINSSHLSPATVKRMHAFFSRHNSNIEKAKKLKGEGKSKSRAYIAALLWGGSAGKSWASKIVRQMEAADKKK